MPLLQRGVSMVADRMPKMIDPQTHALIDYVIAGAFVTMGALFWKRNKRAALSSLICGGAATANALLTDYPGGRWKLFDFDTHGKIDAGLAGLTATMPSAMFFMDEPESRFFLMQGIAETAATALTDFSSTVRREHRRAREAT